MQTSSKVFFMSERFFSSRASSSLLAWRVASATAQDCRERERERGERERGEREGGAHIRLIGEQIVRTYLC